MRILAIALFSLFLTSAALARQDHPDLDTSDVSIIPTPQEFDLGIGIFRIPSGTRIILGTDSSPDDAFAAECLNDELMLLGHERLHVVKEEDLRKFPAGAIYLASPSGAYAKKLLSQRPGRLTPAMAEEGYLLEITPDGAVIIGESPAGRFYGVMSLVQTLRGQKRSVYVPACAVRDWALEPMRGISDDISRGQLSTAENFRKIIRFCARYKLNVYAPYIEDVFDFRSQLHASTRDALSAAEIKDLDAYAKRYHIQLIPIFETLGHWDNFLLKEKMRGLAEFPGAHTLNVSDPRVLKTLFEMLEELTDAFSSPYVHIGADESWDVGRGASKARVAANGIAAVHSEHYRTVFSMLAKLKRKPMIYGDVLLNNPEILTKIPKDVVIVDWHYAAADSYPSVSLLRKAGFPVIVSPAVWSFTGPFPNYTNTFVNVRNFARNGYQAGGLGILTSNWNDNGGEELRELNYLGYAWTAECAWQPLRAEGSGFAHRFFKDFFGAEQAATDAEAVYAILGDPLNQTTWYDLWRHPMLPPRPGPIPDLLRGFSVASATPAVNRLVASGHENSVRNADHWQYLSYVSRLIAWSGHRTTTAARVRLMTEDPPAGANRDSLAREARELCLPVIRDLRLLRTEFLKVWHSTNREGDLMTLLTRMGRQELYWMEKVSELERGILWSNPTIASAWIYHPQGHPFDRDTAATQVRFAYFAKTIAAPERFRAVRVQILGDTHVRLSVNGEEVGEVLARRSLSLRVESQRARITDITAQMKPGANRIEVLAENFDEAGSAGVNIYGEILGLDSTRTSFGSDTSWAVNPLASGVWPAADSMAAVGGMHARAVPYPVPVTRPDLWRERTSWFER